MIRRLVYTVTYGETHSELANLTHPLIRDYAERHGATFVVIGDSEPKFGTGVFREYRHAHPSYEDFRIPKWLETFDEIVHLDTDLVIANDTPWLLSQSGGMMCAVDESIHPEPRVPHLINYAHKTGKPLPADADGRIGYNLRYFNLGVFGVTARDRALWVDPEGFWNDSMGHQTFINYRLITSRHPIRDLGPDFNSITHSWNKYPNHQSAYVIHYAGFRDKGWLLDRASTDISKLKEYGRA